MDGVRQGVRLALAGVLLVSALTACGAERDTAPQPPLGSPSTEHETTRAGSGEATPSPSRPPLTRTPEPSPPGRPARGTVPPPWLGKRELPRTEDGFGEVRPTPPIMRVRRWNTGDSIRMLPGTGFEAITTSPAPQSVIARSTWRPGCPVGKRDLAWIRITYWGFDDLRHSGEMLVNRAAADDLVDVFRQLYWAKFPIESMGIARLGDLDAPPTGDGNGTGSFACRPIRGGTEYSQHAYGLAVDLNPFQNPYQRGDVVLPELASAYLARDWLRPGMVTPEGPAVRAFSSIGWEWGGDWSATKDYQHFSVNGR